MIDYNTVNYFIEFKRCSHGMIKCDDKQEHI